MKPFSVSIALADSGSITYQLTTAVGERKQRRLFCNCPLTHNWHFCVLCLSGTTCFGKLSWLRAGESSRHTTGFDGFRLHYQLSFEPDYATHGPALGLLLRAQVQIAFSFMDQVSAGSGALLSRGGKLELCQSLQNCAARLVHITFCAPGVSRS